VAHILEETILNPGRITGHCDR